MDIRIFICCHKQYETVPPLCIPIQCGAAINPAIEGAISDADGDNISARNHEYCELTAHYYVWKNIKADYYGFCHYRRFLSLDEKTKFPYLALNMLAQSSKQKHFGTEKQWRDIITANDIIVPRSEDMGMPVLTHYNTSRFHYKEDMEKFIGLLQKHAPQITDTATEYLAQNRQHFCNMFIMNNEHFQEYCSILFPVLEEFDKIKTLHGDFQSDRTNGYLAEVFTGIYISYCRKNGARIKELPRIDIGCSARKRMSCRLLPPESRRRFLIKKLVKKFRGN